MDLADALSEILSDAAVELRARYPTVYAEADRTLSTPRGADLTRRGRGDDQRLTEWLAAAHECLWCGDLVFRDYPSQSRRWKFCDRDCMKAYNESRSRARKRANAATQRTEEAQIAARLSAIEEAEHEREQAEYQANLRERKQWAAARMPRRVVPIPCPVCGTPFKPYDYAKSCSPGCGRVLAKESRRRKGCT